ncbi:MAG: hypothetical protein LN589_04840 [Rickettsia endosymbiont of Eriopis connexa]|nr:hypothetical protein [Rickettsia endosymbiont of Eriopis connexa]
MLQQKDLRPYVKRYGDYTCYINPKGGIIVTSPDGNANRYDIINGRGTMFPLEKSFISNLDFYVDETKVIGYSKYDTGYFHKYFGEFGFE